MTRLIEALPLLILLAWPVVCTVRGLLPLHPVLWVIWWLSLGGWLLPLGFVFGWFG